MSMLATEKYLARMSSCLNILLFRMACVATVFMFIPTVVDVLSRFLFNKSVMGAAEFVEFSMVVLVFGTLAYMQEKRRHIRVDLFLGKFPVSVQDALEFFGALVPFVFISLMTWCTYLYAVQKMHENEVSGMLGVPLYIFIFFALIGTFALALALLVHAMSVFNRMLQNKQFALIVIVFLIAIAIWVSPFILHDSALAENLPFLGGMGMLSLMTIILLGMPIGLAMGLVGYAGMLIFYPEVQASFAMLGSTPYRTASNYVYSVVPMFILMGELAMYSGISRDLFNAANVWLGRLPGGLAVASTVGCAGFSAVSGDSMATAVTMASVALPEMKRKKYDPGLACATLAAGGTLGILIPPSTGFIFYALVTEVSIGKLFIAGIIPGILLTLIFICVLIITAKRHPELAPSGESYTMKEKIIALRGIVAMLFLITLILGGILFGWFSPNEGGAVGAAGTLLYALLSRRLSWDNFKNAISTTASVTTGLLLILIGVGLLGFFFAATALPYDLADMVVGLAANKYIIMAAVVLFYIVMGCILNVIPMILLTLPAIFPTIIGLGFDPVWFGVVVVILMEMGQITPPVGINVFALSSVAPEVPLSSIFRRIIPFFLSMLFLVALLTVFPSIALWLPEQVF